MSGVLTLAVARKRVRRLCRIQFENIYQEMDAHLERSEIVAAMLADAVHTVESLEVDIPYFEGQQYLKWRQNVPKPTEDEIEALIEVDEAIRKLKCLIPEAKAVRKYLESIDRKLEGRGMMLTQLRKLQEAESR